MNKHVKLAMILVILGVIAMVGGRFAMPFIEDFRQKNSSDAKGTKGKIRIGSDNWVGYFPLCSGEMKKRMRQSGYLLECVDDQADYEQRFKKLKSGDIEFAVGTVDSYVINGDGFDYPGTIISVLDESKGGDAIVAWADKISSIDDFKSKQGYKIAYTPASPSHHLLKAISAHFDIEAFRNSSSWAVETNGSSDALKKLLNKEVGAAVLWEPDVSKALSKKGLKRVIGTEDTSKLIVDVLIAGRKFSKDNPQVVELLLREYFETLKYYRENQDEYIDDIADAYDMKKAEVKSLLKGVEWASLTDNAQRWYSEVNTSALKEEALIETIESTIKILKEFGSIKSNPIPNGDPYRITNSEYIKKLYKSMQQFGRSAERSKPSEDSITKQFKALSDAAWNSLRELGTLKIRPIVFASGTDGLTLDGKSELDIAIENLKHYPNFRIEIRGHTGARGDKQQNKLLSEERADAVKRYLDITYGISQNRMRAIGFGGEKPLPRKTGESFRSYNYRLPRVELVLVTEEY